MIHTGTMQALRLRREIPHEPQVFEQCVYREACREAPCFLGFHGLYKVTAVSDFGATTIQQSRHCPLRLSELCTRQCNGVAAYFVLGMRNCSMLAVLFPNWNSSSIRSILPLVVM